MRELSILTTRLLYYSYLKTKHGMRYDRVEVHEPIIVLLVIRHSLCDANDYGIRRCLQRYFSWLHWSEIKQQLLTNRHLVQVEYSQYQPMHLLLLARYIVCIFASLLCPRCGKTRSRIPNILAG